MATSTAVYSIQKPVPGGDADVWGAQTNTNWDRLENWFVNTFDSPNNNPTTGYLGVIKSSKLPATITGARVFQNGSSPTLTVERTTANNSIIAYTITGGSIYAGHGELGEWAIGVGLDLTAGNRRFWANTITGNIGWTGAANGDGSTITNLSASNIGTGTLSDARLPSSMTGKTFSTGIAFSAGAPANPYDLSNHISLAAGTYGFSFTAGRLNLVANTGGTIRAVIGNTDVGSWGASAFNIAGLATGFVGRGTSITDLNATELTSGTLANARLAGGYSFTSLTLSSNLVASTVFADGGLGAPYHTFNGAGATGMGREVAAAVSFYVANTEYLRVASGFVSALNGAIFNGPGTNLTALNASNLGSGTVPNARLPTDATERARIQALIAGMALNAQGTYAELKNLSGGTIAPGSITAGSNFEYSNNIGTTSGTSPTGSWMCMGNAPNNTTTLYLKQ